MHLLISSYALSPPVYLKSVLLDFVLCSYCVNISCVLNCFPDSLCEDTTACKVDYQITTNRYGIILQTLLCEILGGFIENSIKAFCMITTFE